MPCRCCGASRPSKGFNEPGEAKINDLLKEAANLILNHYDKSSPQSDDLSSWILGWREAFDHHLNGCKE